MLSVEEDKYMERIRELFLQNDGNRKGAFLAEMSYQIRTFLEGWWGSPSPFSRVEDSAIQNPNYIFPEETSPSSFGPLYEFTHRCLSSVRFNARNFCNVHPNPPLPSIISTAIVTLMNQNPIVKDVSPSISNMEVECIRGLADLIGYSYGRASGNIVSGGTIANITAILVATLKRYPRAASEGLFSLPHIRIITTSNAHYSIEKAARILGIGDKNVIRIPVASRDEIVEFLRDGIPFALQPQLEVVESAIAQCHEERTPVICLILTAGTTETGTIERICKYVDMAKDCSCHLHIDAAIGGYASVDPRIKEKMVGIELSDSVTIDPHKLGYVPYPAGAILFRSNEDAEILTHAAPYLEGLAPTIEGSRSGIGIANTWVMMRTLGRSGYRRLIGRCIDLSHYLADRINEAGFQLLHRVELNTVCFSLKDDHSPRNRINEFNLAIYNAMNSLGLFKVNFITDLAGITVPNVGHNFGKSMAPLTGIRVVSMNPFTRKSDIDGLVDQMIFLRRKMKVPQKANAVFASARCT